jgi:predicted nucleic acid-binding protein
VFYAEKNIDFTDAMLNVTALRHGTEAVCSFDTHFDRVPGISRYTPGDVK